jgi:hypothetical protein
MLRLLEKCSFLIEEGPFGPDPPLLPAPLVDNKQSKSLYSERIAITR